jgi:hypothetical protein
MRKYATAFTRAGTLSFVITSWGGMSSVTVRRSTLTIRSTIGIRMNRPGPFGSEKRRPSRKTIARSYSRATLIAEIRNNTSSKSKIATMISAAGMSSPFECGVPKPRLRLYVAFIHNAKVWHATLTSQAVVALGDGN